MKQALILVGLSQTELIFSLIFAEDTEDNNGLRPIIKPQLLLIGPRTIPMSLKKLKPTPQPTTNLNPPMDIVSTISLQLVLMSQIFLLQELESTEFTMATVIEDGLIDAIILIKYKSELAY